MVKVYNMGLEKLKQLVAMLQEQGIDAELCKKPSS